MPTSTQAFEVLFEFINDMEEPATLEPLQGGQNGTTNIGPIVLLHEKESISLVLNAGSTYQYLFKRLGYGFEAEISIRVWRDTQISVTDVFTTSQAPEGVKVVWYSDTD